MPSGILIDARWGVGLFVAPADSQRGCAIRELELEKLLRRCVVDNSGSDDSVVPEESILLDISTTSHFKEGRHNTELMGVRVLSLMPVCCVVST